MKRLTIVRAALALGAMLALSTIATPPADAVCRVTKSTNEATWERNDNGTCLRAPVDPVQYANVILRSGEAVNGNFECDLVVVGEVGFWNAPNCTEQGGGQKFVWAFKFAKAIKSLPSEPGSLLLHSLLNTFATALETELSKLAGEGALLTIKLPEVPGNSGTYELLFVKVKEPTSKSECNSEGDAAGEVLIHGTFQLVFDSLTILGVASLLLINEIPITCGSLKVKVKGSLLTLLTPLNTEILTTAEASATLHCKSLGVPADKQWWTESGSVLQVKFEANLGTGFEAACENVAATIKLQPTRMIEILG
jgi:hypothetical protein